MATPTIRIKRERKELLSTYATAAISLYGIISVEEFVEVFNHYEETKTTSEETTLALVRLAKTDAVAYSIWDGLISSPNVTPKHPEEVKEAMIVRSHQQGKPHYLPSQEEFLSYVDCDYREPEAPYAAFASYVQQHKLVMKRVGTGTIEGDLKEIHEQIQNGMKIQHIFDFLTSMGYDLEDKHITNGLFEVLMNVHNNTRMYDNNGLTPNELKAQSPVEPLPSTKLASTQVVGRNDPCPCGSGKKYKKCHMK